MSRRSRSRSREREMAQIYGGGGSGHSSLPNLGNVGGVSFQHAPIVSFLKNGRVLQFASRQ